MDRLITPANWYQGAVTLAYTEATQKMWECLILIGSQP